MWGVWAGKGVLTQVLPAHHKDAIEALYKAQVSITAQGTWIARLRGHARFTFMCTRSAAFQGSHVEMYGLGIEGASRVVCTCPVAGGQRDQGPRCRPPHRDGHQVRPTIPCSNHTRKCVDMVYNIDLQGLSVSHDPFILHLPHAPLVCVCLRVGTAIVQERASDGSTPPPANFTGPSHDAEEKERALNEGSLWAR